MIGLLAAAAILGLTGQETRPLVTMRPATPEDLADIAAIKPPATGDWRVVREDPGAALGIDVAHIEEQASTRTVWIVGAIDTAARAGMYSLTKLELDCSARVAKPLWFALHSDAGAPVFGFAPRDPAKPYEEASGGARIAAVVCDRETLPGPGLPTHQAFAAANPR